MSLRRLMVAIPVVLLAMAGCRTPEGVTDLHRMPKYRPVTEDIFLGDGSGPADVAVVSNAVVTAPPAIVPGIEGNSSNMSANAVSAGPVTVDATAARPPQSQRILSRGDRIMISLRGIPQPEEIKNVIDGQGEVTLPYIGQVRVAGLASSEAERLIEAGYIEGGIYRSINVIVLAEDKVYFVQGEVARQGKFSMSGDVTLLQAITEAGGYTPFANEKKVKVIRGDQVMFFNARDIANGKEPDPAISSDDIIVVLKSVF